MGRTATLLAASVAVACGLALSPALLAQSSGPAAAAVPDPVAAAAGAPATGTSSGGLLPTAHEHGRARLEADLAAIELFRPSYRFWRHIFTIPDGAVVFGSAVNGRLLATFPVKGDWRQDGHWEDAAMVALLHDRSLPASLADRRGVVARLLEPSAGPVVHNATRGLSLLPNARRYGAFLEEWSAIYERFAVPPEIGLAQAIVESGLNGTVRSEARAIGFCQWLMGNWNRLKRLAPHVIEGYNQTTQAPYCAAYLTILATRYGSFIPALSEHHTGGTNVGRTLINGERLGGVTMRERYFLGAEFIRDVRSLSPGTFKDVYGTYGPRSFLYAEMVFGNAANVTHILKETLQSKIFAMRTSRALPLTEITQRTGLPAAEVRRFNPALTRTVPARATLYLPTYVAAFGADVSFWHRPATPAFSSVLGDFVRLDAADAWDTPAFDKVLLDFERRFRQTGTEEGSVMATTLAYVREDRRTNREAQILADFRTNARILRLFHEAKAQRDAFRAASVRAPVTTD